MEDNQEEMQMPRLFFHIEHLTEPFFYFPEISMCHGE
jgi:hypothetical protein